MLPVHGRARKDVPVANEIASAYLALYARMPGVQGDIARELGGVDVDGVGQDLGRRTSEGYTRGFAVAGAIGGLVATLAQGAAQSIGDLVGDAVAASDATSKFAKTLEFAGIDTSKIDSLKKSTKQYADDTVYDLATVQNTTAQLAANGVQDYDKLTQAAGNLNAVAGGTPDTFSSVAMALTQTAGQGKLTTENWNQLADAIPGASGVLQASLEKAGAYTGNFRDAMAAGEITADEFNAALMEVGTDPVAVEAAKSTETMEGALGNLNATIVGGLTGAIDAIKPTLTDFIGALSGFVQFIVDNMNWIGPLAAGIGIVVAAVTLWTAVQWLLNAALTANPVGLIIVAIGLLIGIIIFLVQNWDAVVAFLSDVWNGFVSWFMGIMDGFLAWWNGLWTAVWEWIVGIWNGIVAWVTNAIGMMLLGMQIIGDAIAAWWNGMWEAIGSFLMGVWSNIVGFVTGYINMVQAIIVAVVTTISGIWNSVWSGISSFFVGIWNKIVATVGTFQGAFAAAFSGVASVVSGAFEGVAGIVKGAINGVIGIINGAIDGINTMIGVANNIPGVAIPTLGKIPELAKGGIVSKRPGGIPAIIGEGRYDEAVVPLSPTNLEAIRGGGGGGDRPIVMDGKLFGILRQLANGEAQIVVAESLEREAATLGAGWRVS